MGVLQAGCRKEDVKIKKAISKEITVGSWYVSRFVDSGVDETSNFSGFRFVFHETGNIDATKGSTTLLGKWSLIDYDSHEDNPELLKFSIEFNMDNDFSDISKKWSIVSHSDIELKLSGNSGFSDKEVLTFKRY